MNWLILLYFLELGYSPFYGSMNVTPIDNVRIEDPNIYYINMDVEVIVFEYLFVGGGMKAYIQPIKDNYSSHPFEMDYLFKAGLRYKGIEVGFRHFCLHPVRPYEMYYQPQGSTDSGYEELYIRLTNKY